MNDDRLLRDKLGSIEQGARWFHVLAVVLLVIGCVALGGGALQLLGLLGARSDWTRILSHVWSAAFGALHYFILAWLARRAADAFTSIAALIRELGEIV
jgi:hypothetical protein